MRIGPAWLVRDGEVAIGRLCEYLKLIYPTAVTASSVNAIALQPFFMSSKTTIAGSLCMLSFPFQHGLTADDVGEAGVRCQQLRFDFAVF